VVDAALARTRWTPVPWTPVPTEEPEHRWSLAAMACDADAAERADAEHDLQTAAAEARARGLLRRRAYYVRSDAAEPALRSLRGAPWAPELGDAAVRRARDAFLAKIAASSAAERPYAAGSCTAR
jgi:hypothetical protein